MMNRREFIERSAVAAVGSALASRSLPLINVRNPVTVAEGDHKELVSQAIASALSAGAQYADSRVALYMNRRLSTRENRTSGISETDSIGLGVRALVDGSWGFASTAELSKEAAARAGAQAASVGRANAAVARSQVRLAPVESYGDVTWRSAFTIDPWDISTADQLDYLLNLNATALKNPAVSFVSSSFHFVKVVQTSATSEGTVAVQTLVRTNPGMAITAKSRDSVDFQNRQWVLYPAGRGYEYVLERFTPEAVEEWASEAAAMLAAPSVEPGKYDLILLPSHLWLTIHESIGHPTELDRAIGYEANYAGTSFLAPPADVIGKLRYGSPLMNIVGERTSEGALASIGWDEEGVRASEWPMISEGVFVDYQTTREQVHWISEYTGVHRSHGCAHCDSWSTIPFQRMPNMNLLPASTDVTLEDIIGATDRGILIKDRSSYSIDQQRYNFQFTGQVAWEIRNGRLGGMVRDAGYQANTLEFWNSMDMIGGPSTYEVAGSFYDGKGEPGQVNPVSHGCPVARFARANIINTRQSR